jgi:transcriptional regulator with XRE-family HTH domain
MGKVKKWSDEEIKILTEMYKKAVPINKISYKLGRTERATEAKAIQLGLNKFSTYKNNANQKRPYMDYDWCYDRFVNKRMTHQEMADELGVTKRVIQKWCAGKFQLNAYTLRKYLTLNKNQKDVVMFGRLGDEHIDKRENEPIYIESHAEDEKDYLFWKYKILKNLCNSPPHYYPATNKKFRNAKTGLTQLCIAQPSYRLETMTLDCLKPIRELNKSEIIDNINEFGFCLYILDDGNRSKTNWGICVAGLSELEKHKYVDFCVNKLKLSCKIQNHDNRYISFDSVSSKQIDSLILKYVPDNLDIIQKKIYRWR